MYWFIIIPLEEGEKCMHLQRQLETFEVPSRCTNTLNKTQF